MLFVEDVRSTRTGRGPTRSESVKDLTRLIRTPTRWLDDRFISMLSFLARIPAHQLRPRAADPSLSSDSTNEVQVMSMGLHLLVRELGWSPCKLAVYGAVEETVALCWLSGELVAPDWLFDYLRARALLRQVLRDADDAT